MIQVRQADTRTENINYVLMAIQDCGGKNLNVKNNKHDFLITYTVNAHTPIDDVISKRYEEILEYINETPVD